VGSAPVSVPYTCLTGFINAGTNSSSNTATCTKGVWSFPILCILKPVVCLAQAATSLVPALAATPCVGSAPVSVPYTCLTGFINAGTNSSSNTATCTKGVWSFPILCILKPLFCLATAVTATVPALSKIGCVANEPVYVPFTCNTGCYASGTTSGSNIATCLNEVWTYPLCLGPIVCPVLAAVDNLVGVVVGTVAGLPRTVCVLGQSVRVQYGCSGSGVTGYAYCTHTPGSLVGVWKYDTSLLSNLLCTVTNLLGGLLGRRSMVEE